MRNLYLMLSVFTVCLSNPFISSAALFEAQANGDWNAPATWGQTTLTPGIGDDVLIDGYQVNLLSGTINISSLNITNLTGGNSTTLEVGNLAVLNISNNLLLTAENKNYAVLFWTNGSAQVNVGGKMIMKRTANNIRNKMLQLKMSSSSTLNINQNFELNYNKSSGEADYEILLLDNAILTVDQASSFNISDGETMAALVTGGSTIDFKNDLTINQSGGVGTNFIVNGTAKINVTGDLTVNSSGGTDTLSLNIGGGNLFVSNNLNLTSSGGKIGLNLYSASAKLDVDKNINVTTNINNTIRLNVTSGAAVYLAGHLNRIGNFGNIDFTNGTLYLDGTEIQNLPESAPSNGGTDSFTFTDVEFLNSAGVKLNGDLNIKKSLTLTDGIIITHDTALLVVAHEASILGGSSTAYINGPMVKKGSTNGSSFIFPLGNNGIYAPIEVEAISLETTEYTAGFTGCPPPIGTNNGTLEYVNQAGYWTMKRNDGQSFGDITLHWDDASQFGISDTSSLVAAYFNVGAGWTGLMRTEAYWNAGGTNNGYIKGCPPPIGSNIIAFGSTNSESNVLPVELTQFNAYKNNSNTYVYLEWKTLSEENSDYFVIQKSQNGRDFINIATEPANQSSNSISHYYATDPNPEKGNNYYRIMTVDQDRMMSFSNLVNVFFDSQNDGLTAYPNPAKNYISLYSEALGEEEVMIRVVNLSGQNIYSQRHSAESGLITFSLDNLKIKDQGLYFITYELNGNVYSTKFTKI